MLCQQDGLGLRRSTADLPGGVQSIQYGHADIHHRNIRLERLHMTNSLLSVRSFSHDLESESRVSFPAPGPNRSRAWLQSRASVPAYRSVPDLFFCNPTAQHERQSPRHRLRWNSTTRDFFGRFESTLGSPWHASWR